MSGEGLLVGLKGITAIDTTSTPFTGCTVGTLFMVHDNRDNTVAIEQKGKPALVLSPNEAVELAAFLTRRLLTIQDTQPEQE